MTGAAETKIFPKAMSNQFARSAAPPEPSEADIREYAYWMYVQSGFISHRDRENWLGAKACLNARAAETQNEPIHPRPPAD